MAEYIEREALLDAFDRTEYDISPAYEPDGFSYKLVCRVIDAVPAADVEPVKRGMWVHKILLGEQAWFCSECKTIGSPQWKRCPVCEAKMDEEVKHER